MVRQKDKIRTHATEKLSSFSKLEPAAAIVFKRVNQSNTDSRILRPLPRNITKKQVQYIT